MARKIVITSGKGGVGKTTICFNLGVSLAQKKFKVLLVDLDIGLDNLDIISGIEDLIQYDIVDVLEKRCRASQALVNHKFLPSLYILPSVHTFNIGKIDLSELKNVVDELSNNFDYVLIDSPAGVELGFYRAVNLAHEALLVTTPHIAAVRNVNRVASFLNGFLENNLKLVVNRVREDLVKKKAMLNPKDISNILGLPILGVISDSDAILSRASIFGEMFLKETKEKIEFDNLANNLHNGSFLNLEKKQRNFGGGFK